MQTLTQPRSTAVLKHLLFWMFYFALNYIINGVQRSFAEVYILDAVGKYSVAAIVFYVTALFTLPRYLAKKRYLWLTVAICLTCILSYLIKRVLYYHVFGLFDYPPVPYSQTEFFIMNIWWWFQYTLFAFGYWYAGEAVKKEKALRLSEQTRLETEREKLILENAHLRAQINPHFLFNTLGYFHNKLMDDKPELANGIIALSEIMRSSIRMPDKDGFVPLDEEIGNIVHLIEIYRLRYRDSVYINFENAVQIAGLRILPHILVTIVENAFKYGEIHQAAKPLTILLSADQNNVSFRVHNYKREGPIEMSHGIGIRYIQAQLDSSYRDRYDLIVQDDVRGYEVSLRIQMTAMLDQKRINQKVAAC